MPEDGDFCIVNAPSSADGFRLGLMSDFALDILDHLSRGEREATTEAMRAFKNEMGALEPCIDSYFDQGQACEIIDYRILFKYNK